MCLVRLTYGDVGDAEKLEKNRTLLLRPIVTDRTRPDMNGTLLEVTGRWGPAFDHTLFGVLSQLNR